MSSLAIPAGTVSVPRAADPREANARPQPLRFLALAAQLWLLLVLFQAYRLENQAFLRLSTILVLAFCVHYWLPFRLKEPFWIGASMAGAYAMLAPASATALIVAGLAIFGVLRAPIAYRVRLALVGAILAAALYGRATLALGLPAQFWQVFGAIFMFRLAVYVYDLAYAKNPPQLAAYLGYFFILPNYYFLLFPVIDFQTMRKGYYRRDIHDVAGQGIRWMLRGSVQLLLYRVVNDLKTPLLPETVTTLGSLILAMVATYLLYLRVSGQFHLVVGMLHLFGYDLPETHRRYLLAHSLTDFWRRINIYWKDFMVKLVYFPLYFRLRRGGEVRAQVLATAAVFVGTWAFHSYQWFWITGKVLLSWPDAAFWGLLGVLVTVNLLLERRRGPARAVSGPRGWAIRSLRVLGTLALITVLWSLWNSASVAQWLDVLTYWKIG